MLTVENGSRVIDAETYNSVTSAETLMSKFFTSAELTAWSALDTTGKELMLRRASIFLDSAWSSSFLGDKASFQQSKEFPRYGLDCRGVSSNFIPQEIQLAEVTIALAMSDGFDPLSMREVTTIADPGITSESVQVGPISVSSTYAGAKFDSTSGSQKSRFPSVSVLLRKLLSSSLGSGTMAVRRG